MPLYYIGLYVPTIEMTPGTPRTANLVQFFKFAAPYIENRLVKVARSLYLLPEMVSKDLKLGKRFADFCSLWE